MRLSFGAGCGNEGGEGGTPESLEFVKLDVRLLAVGWSGVLEPA